MILGPVMAHRNHALPVHQLCVCVCVCVCVHLCMCLYTGTLLLYSVFSTRTHKSQRGCHGAEQSASRTVLKKHMHTHACAHMHAQAQASACTHMMGSRVRNITSIIIHAMSHHHASYVTSSYLPSRVRNITS
jgi:hypothetical protein